MTTFRIPTLAGCLRKHTRPIVTIAATIILLPACSAKDALSDENLGEGIVSASGQPAEGLAPREREAIASIRDDIAEIANLKKAQLRVEAVMKKSLFDPSSLQLDALRAGRNGVVCGKYNAKNRMGAYVGYRDFVVTKDDELVTSERNDGIASAGESYFYYQYSEYCATKAELAAHPGETFYEEPNIESEPEPRKRQAPDAVLDAPATSDEPSDDEVTT